jgi:ATP-dependent protease HslVU (ClpYQ) peptidase subunit
LFELFDAKLAKHQGILTKAAVELARVAYGPYASKTRSVTLRG